jgi:MoaA/NifB/PqqE/SkfB family radical SAM enzyme
MRPGGGGAMNLPGMMQLNIELTSHCSKKTLCSVCGHQDPKIFPNLKFGDMDFELLKSIRHQLAPTMSEPDLHSLYAPIIEFHRDGDPLDYPWLAAALDLFEGFTTCLVTHGERLAEKALEIIGRCTTVCVSVIENDPDHAIQYESVKEFLDKIRPWTAACRVGPRVIIKAVGNAYPERYEKLGLPIIHRALHVKPSNRKYIRTTPLMPESGICLDFLGRPAIDWQGRTFQCVKLDPNEEGYLGDVNEQSLEEIWHGARRQEWLKRHQEGRRDLASPLCARCVYYGIPATG